jgi:hypothetical protein
MRQRILGGYLLGGHRKVGFDVYKYVIMHYSILYVKANHLLSMPVLHYRA